MVATQSLFGQLPYLLPNPAGIIAQVTATPAPELFTLEQTLCSALTAGAKLGP